MQKYELADNLYKFDTLKEQVEIINYLNKAHNLTSPPAKVQPEMESGLILIDVKGRRIEYISSVLLKFPSEKSTFRGL